jgi:uncharacterized protein (UPF0262 family)
VALDDIRIEEPLWSSVSDARRAEWQRATQELLEEHAFTRETPRRILVSLTPEAVIFRSDDDGPRVEVPRSLIDGHLQGYVGICRRMGALEQGASSAMLEALDMAKKLAHDDAAQAVARFFKPLGPDHRTSRRLFTLLVTLLVDTTRLTMVHAHRARGG